MIGATPTQGLSPLTVSFALSTQAAVEIQSLMYSFAITGDVTSSVGQIDPFAVTFTFGGVGAADDALAADLAQITPSWSSPLSGSLSASIGEYGVVTTGAGTRQLFLIYFIKGLDGVWRLESM